MISEALMTESILKVLREEPGGWLAYHTHDSRRSEPGFPDINAQELNLPYRSIYLELKTEGRGLDKKKWSKIAKRWLPGQDDWARFLTAAPGVEYYHIWPSDLEWLYQYLIDAEAPHNEQGERVGTK